MSGQSRKSPSGNSARAAGSARIARSRKPSLPGSKAPKKTRVPMGLIVSLSSTNSFGSVAPRLSRPWASVGSVPSGPELNSQTGFVGRTAPVPPNELGGLLQPVTEVGRAADHEGVIPGEVAHRRHRLRLRLEPGGPQSIGEALRDPPRRPVSARVRDQHIHVLISFGECRATPSGRYLGRHSARPDL